jgi:MFS family permease
MSRTPVTGNHAQPASLTPAQTRRAMNLNIILGSSGTLWVTVIAPGTIMNVFFKNQLGASSEALGVLVAATQLASVFNLLSIVIFGRLRRAKPFWIVVTTLHRMLGFVPAAVALAVAQGGSRVAGAQAILLALGVSWLFANLGTSGWWRWTAELVPEDIRSTFFGRRSAVINAVTMIWFLLATVVLDLFKDANIFWVYFALFAVGGIGGVMEIVLYVLIPEPVPMTPRPAFRWSEFLEPVRNTNFLGFSFSVGIWLFSVNVLGPFVAPYITAADGIGAPVTWLGIMMVITQLSYVATSTTWGMLMDRIGRKPVVLLGSMYPLSWAIYFFLSPSNYIIILPITALIQGLLSPAILDGAGQMMLTLTPAKSRTAYVAWYAMIAGMLPAGGALLGGTLDTALSGFHFSPAGRVPVGGFQVVILLCFVLCIASLLILSRIREGREKPVGFLLSVLVTPNIFRTFLSINVLGRGEASTKVARALRTVERGSGAIAVSDIIRRLDDPDMEVREEAARALGRIGSVEAVEPLIRHLRDRHSTIRPYAARALGRIGDRRAVQWLIEGLDSASEELAEACCHALGRMGAREALKPMLRLVGEERTERVIAAAGEAMSRLGAFEAALDIFPRMHAAGSPIMPRQFAIALANLLGKPGEFYAIVTGDASSRGVALERLQQEAQRNLQALVSTACASGGPVELRDALVGAAKRLHEKVAGADYAAQIETLHVVLLDITRLLAGRAFSEDDALGFAFMHNPKLGLGLWFTSEVKLWLLAARDNGRIRGTEVLEMDALLGIYFLSAYRETGEEEEE